MKVYRLKMTKIKSKVMLVDDHAMLRHGMAMLINEEPDLEVVAEAEDVASALKMLASEHGVDIVLVDLTLTSHSGLELIKNIRTYCPHCRFSWCPCMMNWSMQNAHCMRGHKDM